MLLRLYLTQIFQSFSSVVSSLIGIYCVILQMFDKGNWLLFHSIIVLLQLKNEKTTTCRALLVFVNSKTKYEHNKIGSDLSISVLNDLKPNFSCSAEKGNLSPKNIFCTSAIDQIFKTSHYLHERKNFAVADLLSRSFFQEQL